MRLHFDKRDALALSVLLAVFALPLLGLLRSPGPPMEEGFMLVLPARVLAGAVPNKDFVWLYGPGSLWTLAGAFRVFGTSIWVERTIGLLQELVVVLSVYGLARRWGRTVALCCSLASLVFLVPSIGPTALPWAGAIALGLLAIIAAAASREGATRHPGRLALLAGLATGLALLYRIDLVLALGLAMLALGWRAAPTRRRIFGVGLAVGLAPYLVQFATAGVGTALHGMITVPLIQLRNGRRLPIPPSWSHLDGFLERLGSLVALRWPLPITTASSQLTIWFLVLVASGVLLAVAGIAAVRRDRTSSNAWVLLAIAGFSVGVLPQAFQRADSAHLGWVSCVTLAFVPVAVVDVVRTRRPQWRTSIIGLAAGGALLVFIAFVISTFTLRSYADFSAQSLGAHRQSTLVTNRGRSWYTAFPKPLVDILRTADRVTRPGQRLLVGPTDLRKTPYSEAFFYYSLPQLVPATRYIEMDPGIANASDSGLANEVRHADVLILSDQWNGWDEPNGSRTFGPNAPNVVVHQNFCLVGTYGPHPHYQLYVRCRS
ncbi:MAG TPA: hypothetical protein VI462_15925 [Acidimicrobiia bacterium]